MFTIKQTFILLLSASVALAGTISLRSSEQVIDDIVYVYNDTLASSNATDAYNQSIPTFATWYQTTNRYLKDVQKLGNDTQNTASLSSSDCNSDIGISTKSLEPAVKNFVNKVIAKKAAFTAQGYKVVIKDRLSDLQYAFLLAYNQLCSKCGNSQSCANVRLAIVGDFQPGINAYSN